MEMGKLTAKLRDAVTVCLLVDEKEIKRYKNIEIPDDLKKLESQDFKFDVTASGIITFKISFAPGVLPEEFPQARKRRTRAPKDGPAAVTAGATQNTTTITALQGKSVEEVTETQDVCENAASVEEVQVGEEAIPETITEPAIQDASPTKKPMTKPKKASAKDDKK